MKNLLLFSIEDLNDWIEPLRGHPQAYTPNITRLANMGALCSHAYAAAPACSPSRTATLFSRFPWESKIVSNEKQWFDVFSYGKSQSLIGKLKTAGMETIGAGKVFHSTGNAATLDYSDWNEFQFEQKIWYKPISESVKSGDLQRQNDFGIDSTGETSSDDRTTDWMIERMRPGMTGKAWALGIFRPHLPFVAPKEFFDKIPENVSLPPGLGANRFDPEDQRSHEHLPQPAKVFIERQTKIGKVLDKHGEYEAFLRAYLASIAYADSKLGLVLDHLEKCDLIKDTLIVLWSDHGWQLGEKLAFRKFTLWERALRVPLIFAGGDIPPGTTVEAPISLVDIAPTILKLLGLPETEEFSGQDLSPALLRTGPLSRPYAPSIWGIGFRNTPKLGYSVRTEEYRYTRYWNYGRELYDHRQDPFEHNNLMRAEDPEVAKQARKIAAKLDKYVRTIEISPSEIPETMVNEERKVPDDED